MLGTGKTWSVRRAQAPGQSWGSAECWVQGKGNAGVCLERGFAMQWKGSEKGREVWDHCRALMRKDCGNGKARQKGIAGMGSVRAGDSLLVGFPWGSVMMRKESARWIPPGANVVLVQCWLQGFVVLWYTRR